MYCTPITIRHIKATALASPVFLTKLSTFRCPHRRDLMHHMNHSAFVAPLPIAKFVHQVSPQRRRFHLPTCVETPPRAPPFNPETSALREGIKSVAIGKHGTKPVPQALFPDLSKELSYSDPSTSLQLQRASFLAALFVKEELLPLEHALLHKFTHSPTDASGRERIVNGVAITSGEVLAAVSKQPSRLARFAKRLLDGERLTYEEAVELGELLYSKGGDKCMKALIAHVMRVRHESSAELAGLCVAASNGVNEAFTRLRGRDGGVYVHIAEPFDGTVTWDLLTPLLCNHLMKKGLKPVMAVGESSGPKYGPNLRDVVLALGMSGCKSAEEVVGRFEEGCEFGAAIDQADAHSGLAEWVELRRTIVKRPAIATAEKYVDGCPEKARVFIGSAFHAPYVGKMADACEESGYEGYVIVSKGMEGSLGLGLLPRRKVELVVGWRCEDGYGREIVKYCAVDDGLDSVDEAERNGLTAEKTAERIMWFLKGGRDGLFGRRVRATWNAFDRAFRVLEREGVV